VCTLLDNDAITQLQAYKILAPSKCKYGTNRYQACDAGTVMQQWTVERLRRHRKLKNALKTTAKTRSTRATAIEALRTGST
jgi:hypothetical protein